MLYRDLQASAKNYKDDGLTEYEDLQAMLGRYKSKGISGIELNSSFEELREQLERIEEAEQDEYFNNYLY
jgi:hypothetical protein